MIAITRKYLKYFTYAFITLSVFFFYSFNTDLQITKKFIFQISVFSGFLYLCYHAIRQRRTFEIEITILPFSMILIILFFLTPYYGNQDGSNIIYLFSLILFTSFLSKDIVNKRKNLLVVLISVYTVLLAHDVFVLLMQKIDLNRRIFYSVVYLTGQSKFISIVALSLVPFSIYFILVGILSPLFITCLAVQALAVVLTFDLLIFLSFVFACAVFLFLFYFFRKRKKAFAVYWFLMTVLILLLGIGVQLKDKPLYNNFYEKYLARRHHNLNVAKNILSGHETVGRGSHATQKYFLKAQARIIQKQRNKIKYWNNPEKLNSTYFEIMTSSGYLGLFFMVAFFVLSIIRHLRSIKKNRNNLLNLYILPVMCFIFLSGFFTDIFNNLPITLIFFSMIFFPSRTEFKLKFPSVLLVMIIPFVLIAIVFSINLFYSNAVTGRGIKIFEMHPKKTTYIQKHFKNANKINPLNHESLNYLAKLYFKTGSYKRSIINAKKSFEIRPEIQKLMIISKSYNRLKKYADSVQYLKKCIYYKPVSEDAYLLLANIYSKTKKYEKAKNTLIRFLKIKPESQKAEKLLEKITTNRMYEEWVNDFLRG